MYTCKDLSISLRFVQFSVFKLCLDLGGGDAKRKQILNLGSDSGARGRVIVCSQNGQELMNSHCSAGCERVVRGERVPKRKHLETW